MALEHAEGWFTDPFGRHEARWMSDGSPTRLVRDGEEESYDDPPDEEPTVTPSRIAEEQAVDGSDLLRAGEHCVTGGFRIEHRARPDQYVTGPIAFRQLGNRRFPET